jgi:hypothetical protein
MAITAQLKELRKMMREAFEFSRTIKVEAEKDLHRAILDQLELPFPDSLTFMACLEFFRSNMSKMELDILDGKFIWKRPYDEDQLISVDCMRYLKDEFIYVYEDSFPYIDKNRNTVKLEEFTYTSPQDFVTAFIQALSSSKKPSSLQTKALLRYLAVQTYLERHWFSLEEVSADFLHLNH